MKKKNLVFMFLFVFLVGVLVPVQLPVPVQANDSNVYYRDIEDCLESLGYSGFNKRDDSKYLVCMDGSEIRVYEHRLEGCVPFWGMEDDGDIWLFNLSGKHDCYLYSFYSLEDCAKYDQYSYYSCVVAHSRAGKYVSFEGRDDYAALVNYSLDSIIYSDLNIYRVYVDTNSYYGDMYKDSTIVNFESTVRDNFDFPLWCKYANLNCMSSTNEASNKIPYSYNSYWHIVRRTSSGKWLLTTIGNSKNQEGMQVRLSENNGSLIIYNDYEDDGTDSSVNGYLANVRQYEYDTDGWKVRSYDTYDFSEIEEVTIELEAGTGLDDTRLLAFTNTDIYSFNGYAILHEASTEYYEVTDTPTVTPEPTPDSGSSGSGDSDDTGSDDTGSSGGSSSGSGGTVVGGDAKPGGMLDFFVTLATLVWTELFAVEVSVDGYMISFQQIVIYSAVVGMLIWGGCKLFGKKG